MPVELLLSPSTKTELQSFMHWPSHALLITGPLGSGKVTVAKQLAADILGYTPAALSHYPHYRHLYPEPKNHTITIDTIRSLQSFITLHVPGVAAYRRCILIEDAEAMPVEAQNALLKLLEEPPIGTMIILTAPSSDSLLPTVTSRVRMLTVLPPESQVVTDYFTAAGYSPTAVARALSLSSGLPGLMHTLLTQQQDHPLYTATEQARELLRSSGYQRLLMVDGLSKQRLLCQHVAWILGTMSKAALLKTTDPKVAKRWLHISKLALTTYDQLQQNTQIKLVMLQLALHI